MEPKEEMAFLRLSMLVGSNEGATGLMVQLGTGVSLKFHVLYAPGKKGTRRE